MPFVSPAAHFANSSRGGRLSACLTLSVPIDFQVTQAATSPQLLYQFQEMQRVQFIAQLKAAVRMGLIHEGVCRLRALHPLPPSFSHIVQKYSLAPLPCEIATEEC